MALKKPSMRKWKKACKEWRNGRILNGQFAHFCQLTGDDDEVPVDETCLEFIDCDCYWEGPLYTAASEARQLLWDAKIDADRLIHS